MTLSKDDFNDYVEGALEHIEETGRVYVDRLNGEDINRLQKILKSEYGIKTKFEASQHDQLTKIG